jgi:hypothetical protein
MLAVTVLICYEFRLAVIEKINQCFSILVPEVGHSVETALVWSPFSLPDIDPPAMFPLIA